MPNNEDNELLQRLSQNVGKNLTIHPFSSRIGRENDSFRFQYTWSGTEGVRYLLVKLVPQGSTVDVREERTKTLEPFGSPREVVWQVNTNGLFELRIFAHLIDGRMLETNLAPSERYCLGKIQPLRYTIKSVGGGWQKLVIRGADLPLYEESLYVKYDGCEYRLPRRNGKMVTECYIPSAGEVKLVVKDLLLPKPENRE